MGGFDMQSKGYKRSSTISFLLFILIISLTLFSGCSSGSGGGTDSAAGTGGDDVAPGAIDTDGDGYFSDVDCDDTDAAINPGAEDICGDGIDQNCDGVYAVCSSDDPQGTFQTFIGGIPPDYGKSALQTDDGGYMVFGTTSSFKDDGSPSIGQGAHRPYLVKLDANGNVLWERVYERGFGVLLDSVKNAAVPEYVMLFNGLNGANLKKVDKDGNQLWEYAYEGEESLRGGSFIQDDEGYAIVASNSSIIKTDLEGNLKWTVQNKFKSNNVNKSIAIKNTSDNEYIILGSTSVYGQEYIYLIKRDSSTGALIWENTISVGDDYPPLQIQEVDDGFIITSKGYEKDSIDYNTFYLSIIKTDLQGNFLWEQKDDRFLSASLVTTTSDNGMMVFGLTKELFSQPNYSQHRRDIFLVKLDLEGDIKWSNIYGGHAVNGASSISETDDGGYIFAGTSAMQAKHSDDMFIIKTNEVGDVYREYYIDVDGDGYGDENTDPVMRLAWPAGYSLNGLDCDDSDPDSYPGAEDTFGDGVDQNCDGMDGVRI
jgi:hypothetical protein